MICDCGGVVKSALKLVQEAFFASKTCNFKLFAWITTIDDVVKGTFEVCYLNKFYQKLDTTSDHTQR